MPILRENYGEMDVYSPIEMSRVSDIPISATISKESQSEFNLFAGIDSRKLSEILDEI